MKLKSPKKVVKNVIIASLLTLVSYPSFSGINGINNETLRLTAKLSENIYACAKESPNCNTLYQYEGENYNFNLHRHKPGNDDNRNYNESVHLKLLLKALKPYKDILPNYDSQVSSLDNSELSLPDMFNDTSIMFSYNKNSNTAFIVFKGNSSNYNTASLLDIRFTKFLGTNTRVHKGIYDYLNTGLNSKDINNHTLEGKIYDAVQNKAKFIVTGHSLGAAIVPIMGAYLNEKYNIPGGDITLVSYSQPPVYDYNFVEKFQKELPNYVRFHNIGDPHVGYAIIGDPITSLTAALRLHQFGYAVVISNTDDPNPALPIPDSSPDWLKYLLSLHSILDYKNYVLANFPMQK